MRYGKRAASLVFGIAIAACGAQSPSPSGSPGKADGIRTPSMRMSGYQTRGFPVDLCTREDRCRLKVQVKATVGAPAAGNAKLQAAQTDDALGDYKSNVGLVQLYRVAPEGATEDAMLPALTDLRPIEQQPIFFDRWAEVEARAQKNARIWVVITKVPTPDSIPEVRFDLVVNPERDDDQQQMSVRYAVGGYDESDWTSRCDSVESTLRDLLRDNGPVDLTSWDCGTPREDAASGILVSSATAHYAVWGLGQKPLPERQSLDDGEFTTWGNLAQSGTYHDYWNACVDKIRSARSSLVERFLFGACTTNTLGLHGQADSSGYYHWQTYVWLTD